MKVNKIMDKHAASALVVKPAPQILTTRTAVKEEVATQPALEQHADAVIFPASDRFKHMLSLIARDNKELYNRIVGME